MGCTGSTEIPEDAYVKTNGQPHESGCFTDEYFSQEQKRLVIESWKLLDDNRVEKGVDIFLRIFQKRPDAKLLFSFHDLEGEELIKNPRFRGHSKRFMNAVGSTVDNMDALDVSCAPTLLQLGHRHATIQNFVLSYMDTFVEAIHEVFENELGPAQYLEVKQAWNAVFRFITSKIEEGYHEATAKQQEQLDPVGLVQTELPETQSVIQNESKPETHGDANMKDISVTIAPETKEVIDEVHQGVEGMNHQTLTQTPVGNCLDQSNGFQHEGAKHVRSAPVMMHTIESGEEMCLIKNKHILSNVRDRADSDAAVTTDEITL